MSEESQENKRLIKKYFNQKLSREEHLLFEQKIQQEDFANEVAQESVRLSSRAKLRNELKDMHQEVIVSPAQHRRSLTIGIALLLLTLLALSYFFFPLLKPADSSSRIFASYFNPYPNVFEQRNAQLATPQTLQQALEAYDNKDYEKAITLFKPLIEEATYDGSYLPFYYAVTLLANHQATHAIPYLQKIASGNSPMLKAESNWYLALAYLQLNQKAEAQNILQAMQSDTSAYNAKGAQQLLEQLKQE